MPTVWTIRDNVDSGWVNRSQPVYYSGFGGGYNFQIIDGLNRIEFKPRFTSTGGAVSSTVWDHRDNSDTGWVAR